VARTLNYEAVWGDMVAMLQQHREAIVAIAGLLIFVPNWITGFVVGPPDLEGAQSIADMFAAQGELIQANWHIMLPLGLLSLFGGASVLTIMLRTELSRIGDAMTFAAKLYPAYLLLTILTAILTSFGVLAFLIGIFYIHARLLPAAPILVAEGDKNVGIWGSIARSWQLTNGLGWKCFLLFSMIFLVGYISVGVINMLVGILCSAIAGQGGVPLVQSGVGALAGSIFAVVMLALEAAIYRHLQPQDS
jgi:hypothetical protein